MNYRTYKSALDLRQEYLSTQKEFESYNGIITSLRCIELNGFVSKHGTCYSPRECYMNLIDKVISSIMQVSARRDINLLDGDLKVYRHESKVIGYLAACKVNDQVGTGYSIVSINDSNKFNKDYGKSLAMRRAITNAIDLDIDTSMYNPSIYANDKFIIAHKDYPIVRLFIQSLEHQTREFENRCHNYFKVNKLANI